MSRPFRRQGDRIRWTLGAVEADLLRGVLGSLLGVLEVADPADPAVARLFPTTVLGDAEADAELRQLIHDDLATVKRRGLEELGALLAAGEPQRGGAVRIDLGPEDALLVLGVLNDLRLAIGARIGIDELDRATVDPDDEVGYRLAVMDHLGAWQELLLAIVDPPAVRVHDLDPGELDGDG
ncbi:DUF2017 family protein [Nitriliruptoraceae bacterium ZYF776]|nr:DUF2017 family protein [Profundirhabdus halotolerans]